jgi:D-aminoacyl-tRNA deacylase
VQTDAAGPILTPESSPTFVIITSKKDPASSNIARGLIRNHGFESTKITLLDNPVFQKGSLLLATVDTEIVEPPDLDAYFNPKAYIFLSRHWAESGIPALTVHTTGNFTDEKILGGRAREVGWIDPDLQKNYLMALKQREAQVEGYQISIEATHHGPTSLRKPVLFVELGASEKNWEDEHAAKVVGDALMESLGERRTWEKVAIAFGGTHYPDKMNKLLLEGDMALSAVVAKYYLGGVDEAMLGQLIQKTIRFPRYVALDWKGLGKYKENITELAKKFALEIVRV